MAAVQRKKYESKKRRMQRERASAGSERLEETAPVGLRQGGLPCICIIASKGGKYHAARVPKYL